MSETRKEHCIIGTSFVVDVIVVTVCLMSLLMRHQKETPLSIPGPRSTQHEGFVYLDNNHFAVDGSAWFPLMVNYKVDFHRVGDTAVLSPAYYYDDPDCFDGHTVAGERRMMERHFAMLHSLGFNAIRICMDKPRRDSTGFFYGNRECPVYVTQHCKDINANLDTLLSMARRHGLRVMLLLKAPMDDEIIRFTKAVMKHHRSNPTLFAYDLFNEPLYFDSVPERSKEEAFQWVCHWRKMMKRHAPHQLFTIGFSEPTEVFRWDPALLPVDFIEVHSYHPLRVGNELWWYAHYGGKPWMVGETALPADDSVISYADQQRYMEESFDYARGLGAAGYGWWEFQEAPVGNFEARYTGLYRHDAQGTYPKPIALKVATLMNRPVNPSPVRPANYRNMLGYGRWIIEGKVIDGDMKPVAGAVIRGWCDDWSIGVNTFSDTNGRFSLVSDKPCTHFEISAPRMSHQKFDYPNAEYLDTYGDPLDDDVRQKAEAMPVIEYQQIPLLYRLDKDSAFFHYRRHDFEIPAFNHDMGTIQLRYL